MNLLGKSALVSAVLVALHAASSVAASGVSTAPAPGHPRARLASQPAPELPILDPEFLKPEAVISSRDVRYLCASTRRALADPSVAVPSRRREQLARTVDRLAGALHRNPQVTQFSCVTAGGLPELRPADWSPTVRVRKATRAAVVIVGGELCSLATAVELADRGLSVAVVYAGPLGGVASDSGANLRYFDCVAGTPHTRGEEKLFREGLGFSNWVAIPRGVSAKLATYLAKRYAGRIHLVLTRSYDSLRVRRGGARLEELVTAEGAAVSGEAFIDSDPESRVAEKCGVPYQTDTPELSYGMVFDVEGLRTRDWAALKARERILPEALEKQAGVNAAEIAASPRAARALRALKWKLEHDRVQEYAHSAFGYSALAQAYDFRMSCLALRRPSAELEWLNARRLVSGFNISRAGGEANFNSLSYRLTRTLLQHSHDLSRDAELRPLREVEGPELQAFLRYVTGNRALRVRLPRQLYVRKSTAFFRTLQQMRAEEFGSIGGGAPFVLYHMDLRDVHPRDAASWKTVLGYLRASQGKDRWNCRASTTFTSIRNLYLLNKCAVAAAFSGGLRIEQNQISTGSLLARYLAAKRAPPENRIAVTQRAKGRRRGAGRMRTG